MYSPSGRAQDSLWGSLRGHTLQSMSGHLCAGQSFSFVGFRREVGDRVFLTCFAIFCSLRIRSAETMEAMFLQLFDIIIVR